MSPTLERIRSLTEDAASQGNMLRRNAYSQLKSLSRIRHSASQKRETAGIRPRHEYKSYFAYLDSRSLNRSKHPHPRKRSEDYQEDTESKSDSEGRDGDATSDGESVSESVDEEEEEEGGEDEEPELTGPSASLPAGGPDSPRVLGTGTSPTESVDSGTGASSTGISANLSSSNAGLPKNPAHLAVLITGIIVAVVFFLFVVACMMVRSKKRQKPGGLYSRYQDLRRKAGVGPQPNAVSGSDKTIQLEKGNMMPTVPSYWDPVSSFSKPFIQLEWHNTQKSCSSVLRRVVTGAKSSIPHIKVRPKSLVLRGPDFNSAFPKAVAGYDEIQPLAKVHTTDSNKSSTLLAQGQENGEVQITLPCISKFSWTTTPSTNTIPSTYLSQTPRNPFIIDENDAATTYTDDTEPPRFRSTTSWVQQQQIKNQQHAQSNPYRPKPPPNDTEYSGLENPRPPSGALIGVAI
ncbi:hypothetical protein PABG_03404 [Paracoccidioides brasiliensis Pb03]|nr:hypothetical protein PABG_03404 [Paracoccidioides brasiliensis Pb03]